MSILKQKQEELKTLGVQIQGYMEKSDGKSGDMSAADRTAWEQALKDFDTLRADIDMIEKSEAAEKWAKETTLKFVHGNPGAPEAKKEDGTPLGKQFVKTLLGDNPGNEYFKAWHADAVKKGYTVGNLPSSGYFVTPLELASEIIKDIEKRCYVRAASRVTTLLNAESLGYVKVDDLDDFDWVTEVAAQSYSTEDMANRRDLTPHRGSKALKISKKLLRLSENAESEIMALAARARMYTEEKAFISGNGNGRPLGFNVASAAGVSTARDQETATTSVIVFDDIIKAYTLMEEGYRGKLVAMFHRNMEGRLRLMKDTNNNYIWSPVGAGVYNAQVATVGMAPTLLGVPTRLSEFMPDPGVTGNITAGTYPIAFCNFEYGYRIADALYMEIIPQYETYANSDELGFVYNFWTDAMPVQEKAFSRVKVKA